MARTPYATEFHNTPQKSARIPAGDPTYIVIHHAASTSFDGVVRLENGGKQVSSTVVIKDGRVASMFDEAYRAWSLSSQYWDSVSLSSETCNETTAPGWTISEASYATLAKVVADWCKRYKIPCNRERIMGHREVYTRHGASYATACPGGIDMDRVVRDANAILSGATAGLGTQELPTIKKDKKMQLIVHRVGANMAYYVASETQLIGPIVMGDARLKGVVAAYGPAIEIFDDGLYGIQDVIETNNKLNKTEGIFDFEVKYSDTFKPPVSTILRSLDSKMDEAAKRPAVASGTTATVTPAVTATAAELAKAVNDEADARELKRRQS